MKTKKKRRAPKPKRLSMALYITAEDEKLIGALQGLLNTVGPTRTIREALVRAGEATGMNIKRIGNRVGYEIVA